MALDLSLVSSGNNWPAFALAQPCVDILGSYTHGALTTFVQHNEIHWQ